MTGNLNKKQDDSVEGIKGQLNLYIKTYGCQMNEYDSEKIFALMANSHGFCKTENIEQADLIVFNTCSVRAKAQEKLFSDLGRIRKIKSKNPRLVVAVGGCVAVQERNNIFKRAPLVDIVFGPQTLQQLPEFYREVIQGQRQLSDVGFKAVEKFNCLPEPCAKEPQAFVSIMEGCNKFCSYCVVPYTRGREVSRTIQDVIGEIKVLAKQGVKEINLLGQNVNNYKGKTSDGKNFGLADLLYECAAIEEIERIRFTTSHPANFDESLLKAFADIKKLAHHLHLPVQSGSNRILQMMRRGYTREQYIDKIFKLRAIRTDISISSDFIVGFPGETADDFAETMELVYEIGFDHSFSFIYSPRPFTKALSLNDNVTLKEKKQRLKVLQQANNAHAAKISNAMIGTMQRIIVAGVSKKNSQEFFGRTENNRVVNFSSRAELQNILGQVINVKITQALPNSLRGEWSL